MRERLLILNLGSTSTKVAVYDSLNETYKKTIQHSNEELFQFHNIWEQTEFRKGKIVDSLTEGGFNLKEFDVIACRGGVVKPIPGGIYEVSTEMIKDIKSEKYGVHPTSVGNIIAYELGEAYDIPVVTADTPVTDEMCRLARYSGIKEIPRVSSFHALNQKRTAKIIADKINIPYNQLNLIVAHLGGGISVASHEKGLVIDVNNALDGEGPFSPERAGTVPAGELIKMCFSGCYLEEDMIKKIKGNGGLMSYLGTNSGLEVQERINNGDNNALEVFEAMAYKICKEIGAQSAVLKGKVDAIVLTGSLAYSELLVNWIKERVGFIAPIHLCPGENEMVSLAENAIRYLRGEEKPLAYN